MHATSFVLAGGAGRWDQDHLQRGLRGGSRRLCAVYMNVGLSLSRMHVCPEFLF